MKIIGHMLKNEFYSKLKNYVKTQKLSKKLKTE